MKIRWFSEEFRSLPTITEDFRKNRRRFEHISYISQSPESRVQSPESRVQSPESSPECSPGFRLCHFVVLFLFVHCINSEIFTLKIKSIACFKLRSQVTGLGTRVTKLRCHWIGHRMCVNLQDSKECCIRKNYKN